MCNVIFIHQKTSYLCKTPNHRYLVKRTLRYILITESDTLIGVVKTFLKVKRQGENAPAASLAFNTDDNQTTFTFYNILNNTHQNVSRLGVCNFDSMLYKYQSITGHWTLKAAFGNDSRRGT